MRYKSEIFIGLQLAAKFLSLHAKSLPNCFDKTFESLLIELIKYQSLKIFWNSVFWNIVFMVYKILKLLEEELPPDTIKTG